MGDLIKRIDNFLEKAVRLGSRAEAQRYGIKLPSEYGVSTPKVPKAKLTGFQGKRQRRKPKKTFKPGDIIGEVGAQLTPKGPYGSVSDIASDISESERLARKITGVKKPEKPKGPPALGG